MIHRAPFGSMDRFVAVLIEHCEGKFPLWLTENQVAILPVSDKYNEDGQKLLELLNNYDIRGFVDDRNEKIGKKIRDNELNKIPFMLIVGADEEANSTVAVRKQGDGDTGTMSIDDFVSFLNAEIEQELN